MDGKLSLLLLIMTPFGVVAVHGQATVPEDTFPLLTCTKYEVINNEEFIDSAEFSVRKSARNMVHEVDIQETLEASIVCCGQKLYPVTLSTISVSATKVNCTGLTSFLNVNQARILQQRCGESCWTPVVQQRTSWGTGYFEIVAPIESFNSCNPRARCVLPFHDGSGHREIFG